LISGCAGNACIRTIVWDYNIVDDEALLTVAASGWKNYVYGAITPEEHQRCAALALTGLITDFPQIVLATRA
jgi:glycerophosphoryl diester phosphodiesterase